VYQPDQSVSSWIRFNLNAYHQQAQTVQVRFERSSQTWILLAEYAEKAGLDERLVSALHDVAMAGRVRRSRYQHAEALSLQQAQRDLRDLVSARILEPVGRTRARYYVAGQQFLVQAQEVADSPFTLRPAYPFS
jgi:Fic family protein